ncbi:hypothetical protein Cocul_00625 [Corynebacterium oculi]|uniref:Uncharacterized protein n=1 Tax=Corynebacterium oculi TaxID=1544416 RepID=A0A0Q0U179_9CORY|nr:hypothetical protein Cocul_00625 [Corynebacterium oculi]
MPTASYILYGDAVEFLDDIAVFLFFFSFLYTYLSSDIRLDTC